MKSGESFTFAHTPFVMLCRHYDRGCVSSIEITVNLTSRMLQTTLNNRREFAKVGNIGVGLQIARMKRDDSGGDGVTL